MLSSSDFLSKGACVRSYQAEADRWVLVKTQVSVRARTPNGALHEESFFVPVHLLCHGFTTIQLLIDTEPRGFVGR